jgi:hypothetical protein
MRPMARYKWTPNSPKLLYWYYPNRGVEKQPEYFLWSRPGNPNTWVADDAGREWLH